MLDPGRCQPVLYRIVAEITSISWGGRHGARWVGGEGKVVGSAGRGERREEGAGNRSGQTNSAFRITIQLRTIARNISRACQLHWISTRYLRNRRRDATAGQGEEVEVVSLHLFFPLLSIQIKQYGGELGVTVWGFE